MSKKVAIIDCTYDVRLADGTLDKVNRITLNLAIACASVRDEKYIPLQSGAWIQPSKLTVLGPTPGQVDV